MSKHIEVAFDEVCRMIDASYEITASAKKKQKFRQPKMKLKPDDEFDVIDVEE